MGKGAIKADGTSYERNVNTHGAPLGQESYVNTVKNLGGDINNPFVIFDDVKELYENRKKELLKIVEQRHIAEDKWRKDNPETATLMDEWFSGKAPKVDWSSVTQKRDVATRVASSVLSGNIRRAGTQHGLFFSGFMQL